jgi:putative transposase
MQRRLRRQATVLEVAVGEALQRLARGLAPLIHYPPQVKLSTLVGSLKGVSAHYLRKEYADHVRKYLWGAHFWSPSYFAASCGGAPLSIIKEYIEQQKRPL